MDRQSLNTPCSKDLFSVFDRRPASVFQITPTESSWKTGVYEGSYRNLFTWLESTRLISEILRSRENNCLENSSMLMISKSSGAPDSTKCWKRLICWTMVRGMLKRRQEGEAICIQSGTAYFLVHMQEQWILSTVILACVLPRGIHYLCEQLKAL